jgi:hypothetical protein
VPAKFGANVFRQLIINIGGQLPKDSQTPAGSRFVMKGGGGCLDDGSASGFLPGHELIFSAGQR